MLQALINGQRALKEELLKEIFKVDKRVGNVGSEIQSLQEEMRKGFKKVHERLDKQGKQLAYLEEDAPTREEFDTLTKQVEKLKQN